MNVFADLHFLRPWWLLALLALPLAWFASRRARGASIAWRAVVDAHLLVHLVENTPQRSRGPGAWLGATLWMLACIALAGPAWERESLPLVRNEAARVLAIELSPTMLSVDLKPNRLARARYKINDILRSSRDLQTALIGYAGEAFVAAPLTDDVNTVANLVDALDPGVMPVTGNATEHAIREAWKLVEQAGLRHAELILLADSASPGASAAAREARSRGLVISVLGIGTPAGAPVPLPQGGFLQDAAGAIVLPRLDEAGLRALAEAGGGRYARLSADSSDLDHLLSNLRGHSRRAAADDALASSERYRDRGPWIVLLMLPLALLAFRRGWLMVFAFALVLPAPSAQAFSFVDLWLRPDQQAARALAAGDAVQAQALARDPALRGSAAYRADDFPAAEVDFARAHGADAHYNRGNTLARQQRYEEALAAYDAALQAQPGMDDALANKQAIEDWLKRQPQDPQPGDESDDKGDGKGDPAQGESADKQPSGQPQPDAEDTQEGQEDPADASRDSNESASSGEEREDRDQGDARDAQSPEDQQQGREEMQKQVSTAIDEALGEQADEPATQAVAASAEESAREQDQALNQWLQRVPDDPGGLLRRKFQLEHERRQRGGGGNR